MLKTILITGGTGFLGSHFMKKIVNLNLFNIICLKRTTSSLKKIDIETKKKINFVNIDSDCLENIFICNQITSIIHIATDYGKNKDISQTLESNLIFPLKIIELAVKYNVLSFINLDSYFNKALNGYNYLKYYSLSKKSFYEYLNIFSKNIVIYTVVLEHIYGENDNKDKFINYLIETIAIKQESFINLTYGSQKRDFIYVDDVVKGLILLLNNSIIQKFKINKTFELGTGQSYEVKEFVRLVKKLSKSHTKLNFGKVPYRDGNFTNILPPLSLLAFH